VYVVHRQDDGDSRFGFIVSKAVGNAVTRNLIRRRLKSVCRSLIPEARPATDVVIRALPGADAASWTELHAEVSAVIAKGGQN